MSRRRLRRSAPLATALAAVVLLWTAPLAAEGEDPMFRDVVDVELVLVGLHAEDAAGRPVLDLGRDEIRVFEDDQPVAISQFTAPAGAPQGAVAAAGAGRQARPGTPGRFIVFLDNLHLSPGSRLRALQRVADLVRNALDPQDEVMVVSFTGRAEVLLPLTTDRGALKRVLREQAQSSSILMDGQMAEERILHLLHERLVFNNQQGLRAAGDPCVDVGFIARTHAEQVYGRVTQTIRELELFVNSLAAYPGRKTLLHVSDGIPVVAGLEAYRFAIELCDGSGARKGIPFAVDTSTFGDGQWTRWDPTKAWAELTQFDTSRDWIRLAAEANTYQVSFYTLQASGPMATRSAGVDGAPTSPETQIEGYRGKQDSLFVLARETGGLAILDKTDFAPDLAHMVDDSRLGYQLAYEPPTPGDGKPHRIRVEVTRPGVEIRYRHSYRSKSVHERMADGMLASLLHGRQDNHHGLRLQVAETTPAGGHRADVKLRVSVPFSRLVLLPEDGWRRGMFTIFVAARDERGEMTPIGQKTVPLRVPTSGGPAEFVYEVELPLRTIEHEVAVGLRDEIGGDASYLTTTVHPASSS